MKRAVLSISVLVMGVLLVDYFLGFVGETSRARQAARLFRSEAVLLATKTRLLAPSIDHLYQISGREDPKFSGRDDEPRRFRTDESGLISGPQAITSTNTNIRILFLGGSTTETNEVDEPFRFPALAAELLSKEMSQPVTGMNLGVRGNTSRDSINLLLQHPAVKKASHVVLMNNINDRLLLAISGSYGVRINTVSDTSWGMVFANLQALVFSFWDFVSHRSNALYLLAQNLPVISPWGGKIRGPLVDERAIDFPDSNFERSEKEYERSLRLFVAVSKILEIQPVLMTQPLGRDSIAQASFNEIMRNVARDSGTYLIDLAAVLPKNRDFLFYPDKIHFNNEGSRVVALVVSKYLKAMLQGKEHVKDYSLLAEDLSFDKCLPPPSDGKGFASGKRHRLLRVPERYPVFSQDEEHLLFQSWTGSREVINVFTRKRDDFRQMTSEDAGVSERHAAIVSVLDNNREIVAFGKKKGNQEQIYLRELSREEPRRLLIAPNLSASIPAFMPDGKIVFAGSHVDAKGNPKEAPNLYLHDSSKGTTEKITDTEWEEWRPVASPDGQYVYYIANPKGDFDIFRLNLDTKKSELVFRSEKDEWDPDISADGRWLVFASKMKGNWDLYMVQIGKPDSLVQLTSEPSDDWDPRFMPKSHAVVYASSRNKGAPYIFYLCPFGEREP